MLELRARSQTGRAIRELLALAPETARILRDGTEVEMPVEDVAVGDRLRGRPGEKGPDEAVLGGTVHGTGAFVVTARRVGDEPHALDAEADRLRTDGKTVFVVAIDGRLAGLVAVADPIKESTPAAVAALHAAGLRTLMLTGDDERTANSVAARHRRGRRRRRSAGEAEPHRRVAGRRPGRRDGGRRHQRRPRARGGRCGDCNGHGDRGGGRERGDHVAEGRLGGA